ncbi:MULTISPECIES: hypothetical protein [Halorussus]|uniref:hypothetical protein n=1 Tax=Halorussus TaxID=1070314 RepID=UPI000E218CF9|nr:MULTISPECIES: hypothetical protein [Halorussus]NHN61514.1 hypothetical protein [Halorussus sp. JP-T4]
MAPLEWLTPDRLMAWLERYGALLYFVLGLAAVYLGLTRPSDIGFFGVDWFVWLGISWVLFAVFTWASGRFRADSTDRS